MGEAVVELKSRWSAKLNEFWSRILKVSLTIALSCAGVLTLESTFGLQQYGVAPMVFTVCSYVLTAAGFMGLAAKLTKA
jgi:hypothetical protein